MSEVKEEKVEILLNRTSNLNLNQKLKNEKVTIIPDSEIDKYIVEERDKMTVEDFYNINNKKIEIVDYNGYKDNVIIPTKIDNLEVTKVNLSKISKKVKTIYIPDTVSSVEGEVATINTNKSTLITINIISIISLIIYIIVISTLSNSNLKENFYNSTTYIFSIIYLIVMLVLCFLNRNVSVIPKFFYIINFTITLIYILLMFLLRFYKYKLLHSDD